MSAATKVNIDPNALPDPRQDPAVKTAEQKMRRLKSELSALAVEFETASKKLAAAEAAEADALVGDKNPDKVRAAVAKYRDAREEIRRQILVLAGAIQRVSEEQYEALQRARTAVLPAWTAARPLLVDRVAATKAAAQAAWNDLRRHDDEATVCFLTKLKDSLVPVKFVKQGDGIGYNLGEVAGLAPAKAKLLVEQGFAEYEERWRHVLHEVG